MLLKSKKKGSRAADNHGIISIKSDQQFIINAGTPFSILEEYKTLRTNLMFSTTAEGCKLIGIASAEASEGKSITCLNIAITFAEAQKNVLLIDCDLRMPKISRLLKIQATPGLSNVLVGMNTLEEAIQHLSLNKISIDVLRAGDIPPNPSELLGSEKMASMLTTLSEHYDYIFIDTPPLAVVSDAIVFSKQLTGYVVVVRAGVTDESIVKLALNQFEFAGATVLGFVLNGVSEKSIRRYSKNKSDSYYKYYRHTKIPTDE